MNHFNYLPPESIEFIFKKLNLNDLINLRIVDKRFKEICDQIKINQLHVFDSDYYCTRIQFYTNDPIFILKENSIRTSKFLNYKSIFHLDKYLKRLTLSVDVEFNFSILNEFKLLEQLHMNTNQLNDNFKLSLNNLKIAHIRPIYSPDFKLTLDTNKLFAFKSDDYYSDQFIFNYPDKILIYETDKYYDKIKIFNNLQHLKLNYYYYYHFSTDILSKFKNLKIIDINLSEISEGNYDNLMKNIISILNQKANLKRSELQIYLNGIQLINKDQINQLKWSPYRDQFKYNLLEFQIKNYDLLKDNCCYMEEINYCDLIKLIKIIPSSFANKFTLIHQVKAFDHIDNKDQFLKFLNDLSYLTELKLINCKLTKLFYDQLINLVYLNELKYLKIEESEDFELNFDFVFNLKKLISFETNQKMNNRLIQIYKSFDKNKYLSHFLFKQDLKNYIQIDRNYDKLEVTSFYLDPYLIRINNFSMQFDTNSNFKYIMSLLRNS